MFGCWWSLEDRTRFRCLLQAYPAILYRLGCQPARLQMAHLRTTGLEGVCARPKILFLHRHSLRFVNRLVVDPTPPNAFAMGYTKYPITDLILTAPRELLSFGILLFSAQDAHHPILTGWQKDFRHKVGGRTLNNHLQLAATKTLTACFGRLDILIVDLGLSWYVTENFLWSEILKGLVPQKLWGSLDDIRTLALKRKAGSEKSGF